MAYVQADAALEYRIRFENVADATGPAAMVVVTDTLDDDLDLSTFELTEIGFANQTISIPVGLNHYHARVPFDANGTEILVDISAELDFDTRVLTITLLAVDPATGWIPEDPLVGLLYPNDETGRGEGHISYIVKPAVGTPSGTEILNRASIVFDFNDPILTPQVRNTLDAQAPTSNVLPLPATMDQFFEVTWTGQDEPGGSGLASFDVYVSVDGGEFLLWLEDVTFTSAILPGEHLRTYAFYSIATDNVGHAEAAPVTPDAQTTVLDVVSPKVVGVFVHGTGWGTGVAAYSISVGSGVQLAALPWTNIDQVQIVFSENVVVEQSHLSLRGVNVTNYAFSGFSYDSATHMATWTLSAPLDSDKLLLDLTAGTTAVRDAAGNVLDGDWDNPTGLNDPASDTFPSGDGAPGGNFRFRLNVLPGDVNGDGFTNIGDVLLTRSKVPGQVGQPGDDPRADLNADGFVNIGDVLLDRSKVPGQLPGTEPSGVVLLRQTAGRSLPSPMAAVEAALQSLAAMSPGLSPPSPALGTVAASRGGVSVPWVVGTAGMDNPALMLANSDQPHHQDHAHQAPVGVGTASGPPESQSALAHHDEHLWWWEEEPEWLNALATDLAQAKVWH